MTNKKQSYLEPIENEDIDLEKKFRGDVSSGRQKETISKEEINNKQESIADGIPRSQENSSEKEKVYTKILSKTPSINSKKSIPNFESIESDTQQANAKMDAESKIKHLIELAQNKGIPYAVKVARRMEDYYVLDKLHDKMRGEELYEVLLKKGMVKRI